jgi:hypothetical protein
MKDDPFFGKNWEDRARKSLGGVFMDHISSSEDRQLVDIISTIINDWFGSIESDYIICNQDTCRIIGELVLAKVKERGIKLSLID